MRQCASFLCNSTIMLRRTCNKRVLLSGRIKWRKERMYIIVLRIPVNEQLNIEPDIQWSHKMLPWWTTRLALEDIFSWFSTLGGAYSSLGDKYQHCAIEAGRLSLKQLKLALDLGDPILQSRCKIFMAQSLAQRGYFKASKKILKEQYKFAKALGETADPRLMKSCIGVWHRMVYTRQVWNTRKRSFSNGHCTLSTNQLGR